MGCGPGKGRQARGLGRRLASCALVVGRWLVVVVFQVQRPSSMLGFDNDIPQLPHFARRGLVLSRGQAPVSIYASLLTSSEPWPIEHDDDDDSLTLSTFLAIPKTFRERTTNAASSRLRCLSTSNDAEDHDLAGCSITSSMSSSLGRA